VVAVVFNVDATVRCHSDAQRRLELTVARAFRAPFSNEHRILHRRRRRRWRRYGG
jgi:hypothetical protein